MGLLIPAPKHVQLAQEYNYSGRPTSSWGTTLTASATPHSLGTRVQILAATAEEYDYVTIELSNTVIAGTVTDLLVNIYLGPGGSETIFIANLLGGWANTLLGGMGHRYRFPVRIPRGSRISADCQALIASDTVIARIGLCQTGLWAGAGVEAAGALTASSRGTQITPGTTSDGTFTNLATTVHPWKYVQGVCVGHSDVTQAADVTALDLGDNGILIPGLENFYTSPTTSELTYVHDEGRYVTVPPATDLEARLQNSTSDTEAKSVVAYGVY